ncbi:hypothetical protein N7475_010564 [Penicillium sp. IBT 31633x]|nr:hypothetical protein N7475_010564 [Penicillium sp. IBT 31633x]
MKAEDLAMEKGHCLNSYIRDKLKSWQSHIYFASIKGLGPGEGDHTWTLQDLIETPHASSGHKNEFKESQETGSPILPQHHGKASTDLHAFLEKDGIEFDKAWVLYVAAGRPSDLNSAMCAYLSKSRLPKDQARTWTIFKRIVAEFRTELDFKNIIRSQLHTEPGEKPLGLGAICKEAMRAPAPFTFDIVKLGLAHMVKNRQWHAINDVWAKILQIGQKSDGTLAKDLANSLFTWCNRFDFLEFSLSRHLLGLAKYLENDKRPAIHSFGRHLMSEFMRSPGLLQATPITTLLPLLRSCRSVGLVHEQQYLFLIGHWAQSETRSEFVKAILIYRQFRRDLPDARPPLSFLLSFASHLLEFDLTHCFPYFMNEMSRFAGKPTVATYKNAMVGFSRIGDVSKVHDLFNRFLEDHGRPMMVRHIHPLLSVHARLGDVSETKRQFQRVRAEFGLEPTSSTWNILLLAHTTASDLPGAISVFLEMDQEGMHDSYSFGTLMGFLAKRGDVENVRRLLKQAQRTGVTITRPMLDTVVQVYCKVGQLSHAEDIVENSWELAEGGSPIRMWNLLLMHYAFRVSKFSFQRILDRIGSLGLKPNAMTYAAVMMAYVNAQQPDRARSTLRRMHRVGLQATEYHYNLLLLGYLEQRNRDMTHAIFNEMNTRFGQINMNASLLNLRMQLLRDSENANDSQVPIEDIVFEHAEKTLRESITRFHASPVPRTHAPNISLVGSVKADFTAKHYQLLIQAYGKDAGPEKAHELLREYMGQMKPGDKPEPLPINFIKDSMLAFLRANKFHKVQECWHDVLKGAIDIAGTFDISALLSAQRSVRPPLAPPESSRSSIFPTSVEKKHIILPAHRFILDYPLSLYLLSLASREEFQSIHEVVAEVQAIGFALTGFNWSTYIRVLATSENFTNNLEAFQLFEEKFVPHFPGWKWFLKGYGVRPMNAPVTILHLDGRWGATKSRRMMGKQARKQWRKIEPDYMHPHYPTMVQLASTLKRLRHTSIVEGNARLSNLYKAAPQTIEILAAMPTVRDKHQGTLLRGGAAKKDIIASPIKLRSTPSGALGLDDKTKARTFDGASQEPLVLKKDQYLERSAADELNLTGLVPEKQKQDLGGLWNVLPPKDRIEMETELHEHDAMTTTWLAKNRKFKARLAQAVKDKDIKRTQIIRRRWRKLLEAYSKRSVPERQLFDKRNRKWKLKTPPHLLFKPNPGLCAITKPKRSPRLARSPYRQRSWTFNEGSARKA